MTEYMHLTGTDEVRAAGRSMSESAETIRQAVGNLEYVLLFHRQATDDQLDRFEQLVDRLVSAKTTE